MTANPGDPASKRPGDSPGEDREAAPRLLWLCVAVALLLAFARGAAWEHRHDEGTTVDLAIGMVLRDRFVEGHPVGQPVPIGSLYDVVEGRSDYDVLDAIDSVVPTPPPVTYRMFHPPAYYALLNVWTKVFGTGRLVMRLPAYLLLALSVLAMYRIGRRVIPEPHGGLWLAALYGVSPWVISITNFARPYSLALPLAVLSTAAVVALHDPAERASRGRWRVLFVVCSALGLYTLYHYAFVLAWHGLLLLWLAWRSEAAERKRELAWTLALGAVIAALFAPWIRVLLVHLTVSAKSGDYFLGAVREGYTQIRIFMSLRDYALADSVETLGRDILVPTVTVLSILTLPALLWACFGAPRRRLQGKLAIFWLSLPLLPLLVGVQDLARGSHTILITKISFGFIILLMLLVVRAWLSLPSRALRTAGLSAWLLLLLSSSALCTYTRALVPSDSERTAALIAQMDDDDHLVVISTGLRGFSVPLLYSMREAGVENVFVIRCEQKDLPSLFRSINQATIFKRVSLVNFNIPQWPRALMWEPEALKKLAETVRSTPNWIVQHDLELPFLGIAPARGERKATRFRELWIHGPLKMRFFHGTF